MSLKCRFFLFFHLWPVLSLAAPKTNKRGFSEQKKPDVLCIVTDDFQDYVGLMWGDWQASSRNDACSAPFGMAATESGFSRDSLGDLVVGQSFDTLSTKDYCDRTPFDGLVHHLRITLLPPKDQMTKPSTHRLHALPHH